nr:root allergen protein-like [Tanacetum cinerariifolium]
MRWGYDDTYKDLPAASTHDENVFSSYPEERFCNGFKEVLSRYKEIGALAQGHHQKVGPLYSNDTEPPKSMRRPISLKGIIAINQVMKYRHIRLIYTHNANSSKLMALIISLAFFIMSTECLEIEVASPFPAEKVFKVFSDFHNIAPKVYPEVYKCIDTIEGDGGVGTIRLLTFGEVYNVSKLWLYMCCVCVPFTSGKFKVDTIDASNFDYSITFYEGDNLMGILDSINQHVKVTPSDNGGSLFKLKIVYNCKGDEKPSADTLKFEKEVYEKTFKAIDAYVVAHPEEY